MRRLKGALTTHFVQLLNSQLLKGNTQPKPRTAQTLTITDEVLHFLGLFLWKAGPEAENLLELCYDPEPSLGYRGEDKRWER
jgi:hypothetical protein